LSRVSTTKLVEVIRKSRGIVVAICKNVGISRQAFYKRIEKDHELKYELDLARDELCDFAEGKMWKLIENGNLQAVMFVLRTLGRHRGYVEKTEIEQTSNVVNIIEVPKLEAFEPTIEQIQES